MHLETCASCEAGDVCPRRQGKRRVRHSPLFSSYVRESSSGDPVVYSNPMYPLRSCRRLLLRTPLFQQGEQRPSAPGTRGRLCRIVLRFEEDRLFGTCTFKDKKETFTLTMDADYNITKDNVLYGVITGSEAAGREDAEEAVVYVDMPFSARVRQDGDLLTVKGVKFLERGVKSEDPKELIVIEGRQATTESSDSRCKRLTRIPPDQFAELGSLPAVD